MYDETVKRLNKYSAEYENHGGITAEAADAIEELSRFKEECDACGSKTQSVIESLQKKIPRWIPVTERLPLLNTPVLATDGIEVDISWMYGLPPRWVTSYTAINEDKLTHWMPLPQTPKGEK